MRLCLSLPVIILSTGLLLAAACSKPEEKHASLAHPLQKWIDEFGQNNSVTWAGKISKKEDLLAGEKAETTALSAAPGPADRDEYLAWKTGPLKRSSGFFRLEKCAGRWWIVAPNGHLFYSLGMDCVGTGAFTPLSKKNREAYTWIPPAGGEFAAAFQKDSLSFYELNLIRKWGAAWKEKACLRALERCKSWGFTCLGNWADDNLCNRQFPYVSMGPPTWELHVPYICGDIADAYESNFNAEVSRVASRLKKNRDDAWLIGYFVDNEMPWWDIPECVLALDSRHACKRAWLARLRHKYGSIKKLNLSWHTKASDFASLRWPGEHAGKSAQADMIEFRRDFAGRFYDAWYRSIKQADPNHLVLGSRIPYPMDEVVLACARHTDVLSFNHYKKELGPDFERYYKLTGKPILIGEYDFDSLDAGLVSACVPVRNQKERGVGYSYYTENAAGKPYMVGSHYFQYLDEPLTGREDGENSFNGFVNVTDQPYEELVKSARKTNAIIYEIHNGSRLPSGLRPES